MPKLTLSPFDYEFLKTIKDYKKMHLNPDAGIYYTILYDGRTYAFGDLLR